MLFVLINLYYVSCQLLCAFNFDACLAVCTSTELCEGVRAASAAVSWRVANACKQGLYPFLDILFVVSKHSAAESEPLCAIAPDAPMCATHYS